MWKVQSDLTKMWFSHGKWEGNNKTDVSRMRSRLNKTNN
jgi:hypothetical protein